VHHFFYRCRYVCLVVAAVLCLVLSPVVVVVVVVVQVVVRSVSLGCEACVISVTCCEEKLGYFGESVYIAVYFVLELEDSEAGDKMID
jgi:hypothetical protein